LKEEHPEELQKEEVQKEESPKEGIDTNKQKDEWTHKWKKIVRKGKKIVAEPQIEKDDEATLLEKQKLSSVPQKEFQAV